jgi:predicted ATPase/class 3 adenylate cyclase
VTFAFTDVVGSTRAFADHGDAYVAALHDLHDLQRTLVESHRGVVVKTEGDGAFLAFGDRHDAIKALRAIQEAVDGRAVIPDRPRLRLRAGAHSGDAVALDGDYVSFAVHIAARVAATAGAGQVIVSAAVVHDLTVDAVLLGDYELKDIDGGLALWQIAGGDTPPRAMPVRRTNVARSRTSFVGRDSALARLRKALDEPGLVTMTGPGGIGKTRLVSEFATRCATDHPGGVWLVELAPLDSAPAIPSAIAGALGMRGSAEIERVADELDRRGEVVLILDNCEHLIEAIAEVTADLLATCPTLRVLATSREPLRLHGEEVLRLSPLETEHEDGSAGSAVELFLTRVESAGGDRSRFDDQTSRRVCALLDGLPLALELAAATAPDLPVPDLLAALEEQSVELWRRGGAARQRTLDNLVSWSLDLLGPRERAAAAALSVFPGGFSPEAAAHVLSDALDPSAADLAPALARRSLLDIDGERYRMLATVRWVTRQALIEDETAAEAARSALHRWCRHIARELDTPWADDSNVFDEDITLAMLEALAWALPRGLSDCDAMLWLCVRFSEFRFVHPQLVDRCRLAVEHADLGPAAAAAAAVGLRFLVGGGLTTSDTARQTTFDAAFVQRIEAGVALGTARERWRAGVSLAMFLIVTGESAAALPVIRTAIEVIEASPDLSLWLTPALSVTGVALLAEGRVVEAEDHYRRAIQQAKADGLHEDHDIAVMNLAELLLDDRRAAEALQLLVQLGQPRHPMTRAAALALRAEAAYRCGEHAVTEVIAREARAALEKLAAVNEGASLYLDRLDALGLATG